MALLQVGCESNTERVPDQGDKTETTSDTGQGKTTETTSDPDKKETAPKEPKRLWAYTYLWYDAPEFNVKKWLTPEPADLKDKFLVVEFWRTWCGACKRTAPLMNKIHEKYSDDFVVVSMTGEEESVVQEGWDGPEKKSHIALDHPGPNEENPEQGAYEAKFGVWGWPHVVILEPENRTVIWEGFPGLTGYELTEEMIKKMIKIKNRKPSENP